MNFTFSDEQEEFRRQVRKWLERNSPSTKVRSLMDTETGFDRGQWKETAALGWQAMAIPEEFGGAGFGYLELAVLFEELGRALFPAPYLSTIALAAPLILELGSDHQKRELLGAIASGDKVVAVAFTDSGGSWETDSTATTATADGDLWVLDGTKSYVIDGAAADDFLVTARTPDGLGVFYVKIDDVVVRCLETMDQTRKLAEVVLDSVRVSGSALLGDPSLGADALASVLTRALALLAAEQVGGAQRCLEMAVEYAKTRHQFGRPIGSFQAIKHKCADMLVQVESAKAAANYAAWAAQENDDELLIAAPLAKAYCSEAFFHCAAENIQIHGGIGFTWEHDAHLYFKRAKSSQLLFGDPAHHRAVLADRLGL